MIFKITEINSHSMEPNFHEGEYYLVKKILDFNTIKRFDVLVHYCDIHNINHIKRVIGLPSEKVTFKDKNFFINDKFIKNFTIPNPINLQVKTDNQSFFLLSDNFSIFGKSCDSVKNGPLKKDHIIGVVN